MKKEPVFPRSYGPEKTHSRGFFWHDGSQFRANWKTSLVAHNVNYATVYVAWTIFDEKNVHDYRRYGEASGRVYWYGEEELTIIGGHPDDRASFNRGGNQLGYGNARFELSISLYCPTGGSPPSSVPQNLYLAIDDGL